MNRFSLFAFGVIAVALSLGATPAQAQVPVPLPVPLPVGVPIVVKKTNTQKLKFKGEVIHANRLQITVRSRVNERLISTFKLSDELQEKMQKIIDDGGYQYGDRVEIIHMAGSDVAIKIKGKPSKPKT